MNVKPHSRALDEKKYALELIRWQDAGRQALFAYVLMKKNRLPAFKESLGRNDVDLANFGVVIAQGSGVEPPPGFEQAIIAYLQS